LLKGSRGRRGVRNPRTEGPEQAPHSGVLTLATESLFIVGDVNNLAFDKWWQLVPPVIIKEYLT